MSERMRAQFDALVEALIRLREEKRKIYETARNLGFDKRTLHAAVSLRTVSERVASGDYWATIKPQ